MIHDCEHLYPVIDEHEGTNVCCDCGLVLENKIYMSSTNNSNNSNENIEPSVEEILSKSSRNDALEILNRLNLSTEILNQLAPDEQKIDNLYDVINKKAAVTSKEFCAATGMNNKKLVKLNQNKIMHTNIYLLLEKYCKLLDLTFKDYTLIKASLEQKPPSGHPPLTVIGYHIFSYCQKNKKKKSMKEVCSVLSISTVSLQRYRKYEFSCGSEISKR
jgi:transcription initiation factor TFIIIB Brf1 subunit/transcription initiation factor TFIIB